MRAHDGDMFDDEPEVIAEPARTLKAIRADLMALEDEVIGHLARALDEQDHERASDLAVAEADIHRAVIKLSAFVYSVRAR